MNQTYDLVTIGLGPAGMAVSAMGAALGLRVGAVEKEHLGGECMNVGCIPSKALLRLGHKRALVKALLSPGELPDLPGLADPFGQIAQSLEHIASQKTAAMLDKVELIYRQGPARFLSPREIEVGGRRLRAKRFFICAGTRPAIPDIPGLRELEPLTNETLFKLQDIPSSLLILGGGAIACEMAQAFQRLGAQVTMVFRGPGLLWREDSQAGSLLEQTFIKEGIVLERSAAINRLRPGGSSGVQLSLADGRVLEAEKVLCALGRAFAPQALGLDQAQVLYNERGIVVDEYLRTSQKHIYACGDVNGEYQFSHAAMHQGMLALLNCFLPWPLKRKFRNYPVPWTIFTEPQISRVGLSKAQLDSLGQKYEVVEAAYSDYGAAIAEKADRGFVKVAVGPRGKILGVTIVGEGSGEMINEWTMALQNRLSLPHIMMQQHSFPTMGFLSKRCSEIWMMNKMRSEKIQGLCRRLYALMNR